MSRGFAVAAAKSLAAGRRVWPDVLGVLLSGSWGWCIRDSTRMDASAGSTKFTWSRSSTAAGSGRALMAAFGDWATGTAEASSVAVATRSAHVSYEALGYAEAAVYHKKGLR